MIPPLVLASACGSRSASLTERLAALFGADLGLLWIPTAESVTKNGSNVISAIADLSAQNHDGALGVGTAPTWVASTHDTNGHPVIRFAGAGTLDTAAWTSEAQPYTVIAVATRALSGDGGWLFSQIANARELFSSDTYWMGSGAQVDTTFGGGAYGGHGSSQTNLRKMIQDTHVIVAEYNGASSKFYADDSATPTATVNAGTNASTAFRLGGRHSSFGGYWSGDVAFAMVLNRLMSAGERAEVMRLLRSRFMPPQVVFEGDAFTYGWGVGSPGASTPYPTMIQSGNLLGRPFCVRNVASNAHSRVSNCISLAATSVDPFYNASRPANAIVLWAGLNDSWEDSVVAADSYADILTYVAAREAVGWSHQFVCTIPHAQTFTGVALPVGDHQKAEPAFVETQRLALNALIRANAGGDSYTAIDLAADERLSDYLNATYFIQGPDETRLPYLKEAGYAVVAELVAAVVGPALS